ncbi:MAG: TetR/AcrR family transcriptional regulator [Burkholderiaceae bacterium]|nr:TetR/AcrR family transcriptional regulator [Burkholderiaceae bacterium]
MVSDTKTALMDIAEHAARSRGVDGFSYADLAGAIGIRKASVHYHFPTKDDLAKALVERYQAKLRAECNAIDAVHATGGARLRAVIAFYRSALADGKEVCLCVALSTSRESLSKPVTERIGDIRAMMVSWLKTVYLRGADDHTIECVQNSLAEAYATLALLEGAHLAARTNGNILTFDAVTELISNRCR